MGVSIFGFFTLTPAWLKGYLYSIVIGLLAPVVPKIYDAIANSDYFNY
jgi:hypothetical protein